jgi:dienelactone hydrolase
MVPGTTFHDVREGGVVGRFYEPPAGKCHGALILIGGSDGPRMDSEAALLASHGYSALAIKYFGEEEELPRHLCSVPIEYFKQCIDWVKQKTGFTRIGFLGRSKGAEAALITASLFPEEVGIVIANIPSSVVLFGIKSLQSIPFPPAWTYQGKPLPYLNVKVKFHDLLEMTLKLTTGQKFSFADYHRKAIEDQESFEKAVIQVENLKCPLILVSAGDDNIWPSPFYCQQIMERLKRFDFSFPHEHWSYEKAGHYIGPAHWPASMTDYWKVPGYKLSGPAGGEVRHNAIAAVDFWEKSLQFLTRHFKNH